MRLVKCESNALSRIPMSATVEILVVLVNSDRNDPVKRNIARYSNHWFVYSIVGSISLQDAITIGEKMTSRPAEDNKVAAANEGL